MPWKPTTFQAVVSGKAGIHFDVACRARGDQWKWLRPAA